MATPLNLLIVEDSPDDADMLLAELRRAGFDPKWQRVQTEPDFLAELAKRPDIVLSDYSMPEFSGLRAADLVRQSNLNIPFILISGTVGEDVAVEAMQHGATDYLLKDRIVRLGHAVKRALREAGESAARKQLQDEVVMRLQRFNAFFTHAPAGLALLDKQLRYVQLNETVAQANGLPIKDHLGKTVREILPRLAPIAEPLLQKVLTTGEPMLNIELAGETPSQPGVIRHWMESFFPVLGKDGQPESVGVIFVEITERKRAEEELLWKTAFLEAQVDAALDGILVVDSQGRQILQNDRLRELWQLPAQMAEDKDDAAQLRYVASLMKRPEEFVRKVNHLYAHPDEVSRDEIEFLDGRVLDRYSSPVRDKRGKYYGRIWTFRDLTEHRKLETQFRQAQKMESFGQLAGGVAHDFNNILAIIQMQAGMMKISGLSPAQVKFADEISATVDRAAALTSQLLIFSRKQSLQPHNLNLNQLANSMAKMLARILGEHIELQLQLAAQPLFVHADAGMMDQILMNLAVNSRDAMPKGGRLIIETSAVDLDESVQTQSAQARPGPFVCLSVSDNGCGIPPEILPRIFEPFFTTKEVGKGTGLGLATVFGIVQQHRGWINVQSEVGIGTRMEIFLPRLADLTAVQAAQKTLAVAPTGQETILLVEDEETLRRIIKMTLTRLGYHILEAESGVQALKIWHDRRADIGLLLTDLMMPNGMDGKELAQRLLQENPELKVIYMSGYGLEVIGEGIPMESGVNFLAKPFNMSELAQIIRQCLDKND